MNDNLIREVTSEEIKKVTFDMNPLKAPEVDGHLIHSWNQTLITLIPKIKNLSDISQYRPISLCSMVYKIIGKIIVARIKRYLPTIISPNQSAFIGKR
ncbi:hypothetical protein P3S67_021192 [Capsicum chacoense]